jgi:DNA-binding transcriptional MerR regulator
MTINEAAHVTGWSPRMLRYIERTGLVAPVRSASGYRLYDKGEELLAATDQRSTHAQLMETR